MIPIPFSKKAGEILWAKGAIANTFGVVKTGELAVRTENDPCHRDSKTVFQFVPGMVLGESSILGMVRKKEEHRNACIFVPHNCKEVTGFEYHPEFLKYEIENGRNDLAYSLITNLWAHTIVNYHRLQYGNQSSIKIQESIKSGIATTMKSMKHLHKQNLQGLEDFSEEFIELYHKRDYSRNFYTDFTKYTNTAGLNAAYDAFLHIFENKTNAPIQFNHLLSNMLGFIKDSQIEGLTIDFELDSELCQ